MAETLELRGTDFLSSREARRFYDELIETLFRKLRQLPSGRGKDLLDEMRQALDAEIVFEQKFQADVAATREAMRRANNPDSLGMLHKRMNQVTSAHFLRRESLTAYHDITAVLRDDFIRQILHLAEEELVAHGEDTPPRYAWLVIGATGRREAGISEDLECVLVHEPGKGAATYCATLARHAVTLLTQSGFRKPESGMMPDAASWRSDLDGWRKLLGEPALRGRGTKAGPLAALGLFSSRKPAPAHPLLELADLHTAAGDAGLGAELAALVRATAVKDSACLTDAVQAVVSLPSPFNLLGNLKVEWSGAHRGKLDLHRWACLPLVTMVRLLAITSGQTEIGTLERINSLMRGGALNVELGKQLLKAGEVILRLKALMEARGEAGPGEALFMYPDSLSYHDEIDFREALETLTTLQKVIHSSMAERV